MIRGNHQRWQQKKICLDQGTYFFLLRGRPTPVTGYLQNLQHHYIQGLPVQISEHPGLTEPASSMGWTWWFHSSLPNEIIIKFWNKFDSNFSKLLIHDAWSKTESVFGSHNKIFSFMQTDNFIGLFSHKIKMFLFVFLVLVCFPQMVRFPQVLRDSCWLYFF